MAEHVIIASNAVVAKLHNPSRELKLAVQTVLSYQPAGAEMSDAFKSGTWDGKSSFLKFKDGTFPAGFVHLVSAALRQQGYTVQHARKPLPEPLGPVSPKVDGFPDDPRYDYQPQTVERLLKFGAIIAQLATGAGKSKVAKLAIARIGRPTLFLTTRSILMYQMKDAIERDMGIPVSVLGDGRFGHTIVDDEGVERQAIKKVCVGMVQTLMARLAPPDPDKSVEEQNAQARRRNQTIKLLEKFELVIGEEAHEAGGQSYYDILQHCKNAHYRLALTATPFMKDDEESNMRLMAAFGPIGIKVSEKLLIERGILAKPYFKYVVQNEAPPKLFRSTPYQAAYRLGIVDNAFRNTQIAFEAARAANYGMSVMILVQQTRHGEVLEDMLKRMGIRAAYIKGDNNQNERKKALQQLASDDIQVLIGTTILDVGVDVPAVGMVILAGGGKAEVALRQRIGRGLRAKKRGPNVALVVDFRDEWSTHLAGHSQQRRAIVDGTEGFGENVLRRGDDFDFVGLGLAAKAA
ncbi:DEAD/DEAH box helicase [Cupriavidus campinensis]|uniref:DEAD/DEAH box helicase n=1 Tax=Cupriavidus campinensis TaxID=151783 RepID=A0ABY3ESI6_9BURK|nr:DEAD/DEAH box helicase [Cupriavidus campinensis]TSP13935.1 DEAD/DEAH box helicase [Cupriavidus campinensis]